jgi:hypothetical protein
MMGSYAREQASTLLRRMAFCVHQAAQNLNARSVRDLHAAISQFSECLRIFHGFYPQGQVKKIRRRSQKMMQLAHEVLSRESALLVMASAGTPVSSTARMRISRERNQATQELVRLMVRWKRRNVSRKWRTRLGL